MRFWQSTLESRIAVDGIGVHGGERVSMALLPSEADSGVVFARRGEIPARYDLVASTPLSTRLANGEGDGVATVEHFLAACFVCGLDNVRVELDADELPILDGSAKPFAELIFQAGLRQLDAPLKYIRVLKTISVEEDGKRVELSPHEGFALEVEIDFGDKVIGRQCFAGDMAEVDFLHEVLPARTFAFAHQVEALRERGLALGGTLENAIVVGEEAVLNEEGLRFENEFARHKALDVLGDLFLAGAPLLGRYRGFAPGHGLNNRLLRELFATPGAWETLSLQAGGKEVSPTCHREG